MGENSDGLPADLGLAWGALRGAALGCPEVVEEFPWGHSAFKVRGRSFLFLSSEGGRLGLSVKLPQSREFALEYPFTEPTGYGLGRAGWVTARFETGDEVPLDVLEAWIGESFRAIAPRRLLGAHRAGQPAVRTP